jgi:hypothetical protein
MAVHDSEWIGENFHIKFRKWREEQARIAEVGLIEENPTNQEPDGQKNGECHFGCYQPAHFCETLK